MDVAERITIGLIAVLIMVLSFAFLRMLYESRNSWKGFAKTAGLIAVMICLGAAIAMLTIVVRAMKYS